MKRVTEIIIWCVMIFSLLCAATPKSQTKSRTEVNTVTNTKDSGLQKEVYSIRPAQCGLWVEVDEPPDDAEFESILIRSATKLEDLAVETIIPDPQDVEYLAIAIYCEAGADYISDDTRYMVGDVILNRVADDRFPDSIAAVLTQKAQYGRFYWTGIVWPERAKNASESHAVSRAREITKNLLTDARHSELYGKGYIYQAEFSQGRDNVESDGIIFGR